MNVISDLPELLLKHLAVVLLILIGSLLVRRRSAAIQHRYWLMGFVWVALLPLLALRLPQYPVVRSVPDPSYRPPNVSLIRNWIEPARNRAASRPAAPPTPSPATAVAETATQPAAPAPTPRPWPLEQMLVCLYAAGALIALLGLEMSLLALRKLAKTGAAASQNGNFPEFDSFDDLTAPRSNESVRILDFGLSSRENGELADSDLSLFDAFGITACTGRTVVREPRGRKSVLFFMPETKDAPPQDFVVRLADPAQADVHRMSLDEAFTTHTFMPVTGDWSGSQKKEKLVVSRSARLQAFYDEPQKETQVHLMDAEGHVIHTLTAADATDLADRYTDRRPLDRQFVFASSDTSRIAGVEVASMPYRYVRFPNVHVNPASVQESAK